MRWRALGVAALAVLVMTGAPLGTAREAAAAPSDYQITGIDVSHYQGVVDWSAVAASGEDFAYAKATEGLTYTDPNITANRLGARANGILFGAYHYGRPEKGDPRGQADRLIDAGGYTAAGARMPPMLDIEWPWFTNPDGTPYDTCYNLTPAAMVSWINQFVDQVRVRTGGPTMIYTNVNWWNSCTGNTTAFSGYPLFVARYNATAGTLPSGWTNWTLWQYTSSGSVSGVTGAVDRDVYNGTPSGLANLTKGITDPNLVRPAPRPTGLERGTTCPSTGCPSPTGLAQ